MSIDTTKIEGYAEMSPEDKIKALEGYDPSKDGFVQKSTFDKTASELSDTKKKYRALLDDDERKKQESEDSIKSMQEELDKLRKEKALSENKTKLLGIGYSEELATQAAVAVQDGDLSAFFESVKSFVDEREKAWKADALKATSTPPNGSIGSVDYDKQIADAQAMGDMATAAALIRKKQER